MQANYLDVQANMKRVQAKPSQVQAKPSRVQENSTVRHFRDILRTKHHYFFCPLHLRAEQGKIKGIMF